MAKVRIRKDIPAYKIGQACYGKWFSHTYVPDIRKVQKKGTILDVELKMEDLTAIWHPAWDGPLPRTKGTKIPIIYRNEHLEFING